MYITSQTYTEDKHNDLRLRHMHILGLILFNCTTNGHKRLNGLKNVQIRTGNNNEQNATLEFAQIGTPAGARGRNSQLKNLQAPA